MVQGLLALLVCQLLGQFLVTGFGLPLPGPVVGMVLLLVAFRLRRPDSKSNVVRASDALLDHLQLLFIPAGVGVIQYLPLIASSWAPVVAGLVLAWAATLATTAGAGAASLRLQARLRQRSAAGRRVE